MGLTFKIFGTNAFLTFYAIPCIVLCTLYGLVIIRIKKKKQSMEHSTGPGETKSTAVDKASSQLTKTAIIVTAIFILSLGFNMWYYVLGTNEIIQFRVFDPLQILSLWFTQINSFSNPFVYLLIMPVFRKAMMKTFCGWRAGRVGPTSSQATTEISIK